MFTNGIPLPKVLKQFFAISLLLCLCFQSVLKLGIVAWYEANKAYVAKELCENKTRPQMKCNGKCYLRKQLNKTENNQQQNQQSKQLQVEGAEFLPVASITFTPCFQEEAITYIDIYTSPKGYNPLVNIFHPPQAA